MNPYGRFELNINSHLDLVAAVAASASGPRSGEPATAPARRAAGRRRSGFLGRYLFNITASGPDQGLRPFCDPDAPEDGDEEEWPRSAP